MVQTISVNTFKDLIQRYPSWDDLQKFLESSDGGMFRIVDKDDNGLCLIRYEKGVTKMDLPHSKWFRSVVWNTKTNMPVCMAPPKATSTDFPFNTINDIVDANIVCQELLDGFMINCFKIVGDETLYITSRSKLNAAGKFYSQKSFRELFIEAYMNTFDYPIDSNLIINDAKLRCPDSSKKEIATFYSFLVQHIEHRIVSPINKNVVYLIHSGTVYEDGNVVIEDSPEFETEVSNITIEPFKAKGSYAQIAASSVDVSSEQSEVQRWIKMNLLNRDWKFQGLVFKDTSGNRWRFRSEKYTAVKALRGNSSNIVERFSQLYTQNLVHKYLEYYEEDLIAMTVHLMFLDAIIKIMYDNYVDLHIMKTKSIDQIDKVFLPHLYSIHGIYLSQLRPNNKKVNQEEIRQYLHKQPWQRIAFIIKKLIEQINAEST